MVVMKVDEKPEYILNKRTIVLGPERTDLVKDDYAILPLYFIWTVRGKEILEMPIGIGFGEYLDKLPDELPVRISFTAKENLKGKTDFDFKLRLRPRERIGLSL